LWLSIGIPFGNVQAEHIAQPDYSLASLAPERESLGGMCKNIGSCFEWVNGVELVLTLTDEHDAEANMLKCREFDGCKTDLASSK